MPTYTMKRKDTGEEKTMILSLSEREEFLKDENWFQKPCFSGFVSSNGGALSKSPEVWRDILRTVKKNSGKNNTINV